MNKKLWIALAALILLGLTSGTHDHDGVHIGLNAQAMNAAAGSRTFTLGPVDGFATIQFWFDFTHTTDGIISLTCTGGPLSGDKDYTLTQCAKASTEGECAAIDSGVLKSGTANLTADKKWDGRLGMRGARYMSCVAVHDNTPAAGDILTVKWESYTQ